MIKKVLTSTCTLRLNMQLSKTYQQGLFQIFKGVFIVYADALHPSSSHSSRLWKKLYLSFYWMDVRGVLYRHSWFSEDESFTFPWSLDYHEIPDI